MANNPPIDLGLEVPVIKPRNPWIALLLSIFTPGVGQVYNGQWKKGLVFFLIIFGIPAIFGITRWATFFSGFVICIASQTIVRIYNIIDAIVYAKRQAYYTPKPHETWKFYLGIAIVVFAANVSMDVERVVGVGNYVIPTSANEPTVIMADRTIADLRAYKGKSANYGDLAVFNRNGYARIYRIVGLPGDQLEIIASKVVINGVPAQMKMIGERDVEILEHNVIVQVYEETLPGGHKHQIYIEPNARRTGVDSLKLTVPAESYYLMGDSRDNAMDSRFEGPVPKDSLVGKIVFSYWGKTPDRINIDLR